MSALTNSRVAFDDSETRYDEMHRTIEDWVDDLLEDVDDAQASGEFQEWLNVRVSTDLARRNDTCQRAVALYIKILLNLF